METTIVKHEGNKIEIVENNEIKEYELEDWVKPDFVSLGNAEITIKDGKVAFVSMKKAEKPAEKPGSTKEKTGKWEDDMVTFEDLLTAAHKKSRGIFSIKTEMLQIDREKKYALFKAIVRVGQGVVIKDEEDPILVFEGHGDATETNVKGSVAEKHWIRMAETRAIVRALRWYTNNGCAEEEK